MMALICSSYSQYSLTHTDTHTHSRMHTPIAVVSCILAIYISLWNRTEKWVAHQRLKQVDGKPVLFMNPA